MTVEQQGTREIHALTLKTWVTETADWLEARAARAVFSPGHDGIGMGWVIENRDGSIVLARQGETLVFEGGRITRQ